MHLYNYSYSLEIEDKNKQQLLHLDNHMDGVDAQYTSTPQVLHINCKQVWKYWWLQVKLVQL